MAREDFIGKRAYHPDSGHEGIILDVNLAKQTALFQHDNTDRIDARWVNLYKLQIPPPGQDAGEGEA